MWKKPNHKRTELTGYLQGGRKLFCYCFCLLINCGKDFWMKQICKNRKKWICRNRRNPKICYQLNGTKAGKALVMWCSPSAWLFSAWLFFPLRCFRDRRSLHRKVGVEESLSTRFRTKKLGSEEFLFVIPIVVNILSGMEILPLWFPITFWSQLLSLFWI